MRFPFALLARDAPRCAYASTFVAAPTGRGDQYSAAGAAASGLVGFGRLAVHHRVPGGIADLDAVRDSESDEQNESIKTLILYYTVWASGIFAVYPLLTHLAYRRFNRAQLRMLVARERRQGRVLRFLLTGGNAADWGGVVTLFSLGVVALVLIRKELQTPLILGLSLALVVSGWFMMLIVYATEYLKRDLREGGLLFPGAEPPIYLDYLYFAQQIQTTYGGSDVSITETQMRRRVNSHNLLSFASATFVVALLVSALLTVTGR